MLRKFMRGALYVAFAMVALWIIVNVIAMAVSYTHLRAHET